MIPQQRRKAPVQHDEATEILHLHHGDALEALRTMIAERDAVEERLAIATLVMMRGDARTGRA